jgi:hypothetical protein
MRRAVAFLTVCLCAGVGCRGGVAQERYDGFGVTTRSPAAPAPVAEAMASEVDVPWTLALLSDGQGRPVDAPGDVVRDERVASAEEPGFQDAVDLEVAFEHDRLDEKPATSPKSCPGVVKGRS